MPFNNECCNITTKAGSVVSNCSLVQATINEGGLAHIKLTECNMQLDQIIHLGSLSENHDFGNVIII